MLAEVLPGPTGCIETHITDYTHEYSVKNLLWGEQHLPHLTEFSHAVCVFMSGSPQRPCIPSLYLPGVGLWYLVTSKYSSYFYRIQMYIFFRLLFCPSLYLILLFSFSFFSFFLLPPPILLKAIRHLKRVRTDHQLCHLVYL